MKPLLAAVGWLGAALGSLLVAGIPYDFEESVCGVWGCFPPLQALAAMHLLWCVALGAVVSSICKWRPGLLLPLGVVLFIVAAASITAIVGIDLTQWLKSTSEYTRAFWPKRIVYTLATLTDVPLVQSLLAALVCIYFGRQKKASTVRMDQNPGHGSAVPDCSGILTHNSLEE
jgi:hypothetical protein